MKRLKIKKISRIMIVIMLILILLPYIVVETNTLLWGEQFKDEYKQTNMIDDVKFHKVFYINDEKAKIYYSSKFSGDFVYFVNNKGKWEMECWDTVWSKNGSAEGITFPFYR